MTSHDERYEYAVVLHQLVTTYDWYQMRDGTDPHPGLSERAWDLLRRDYGGQPLPTDERQGAL